MRQSDKKSAGQKAGRRLPEPDTAHERNKATPESDDLADPTEVWKDGENTPSTRRRRATGGGRVADAEDLRGGSPSPYSEEMQAETVARQTRRTESGN